MKNIYESRNFFLDIFVRKKHIPVFVNYLIILPIWQILFLFLFACFGFHELFLFLFIQKLASQTCSYSYLREKLLFADHCYINPVHNCFFYKSYLHPILNSLTFYEPNFCFKMPLQLKFFQEKHIPKLKYHFNYMLQKKTEMKWPLPWNITKTEMLLKLKCQCDYGNWLQ